MCTNNVTEILQKGYNTLESYRPVTTITKVDRNNVNHFN